MLISLSTNARFELWIISRIEKFSYVILYFIIYITTNHNFLTELARLSDNPSLASKCFHLVFSYYYY